MLPREQRLTARRDFKRVYAGGRAFVNRLLVLRALRKDQGQVARFGFSTSSKMGNAVLRNRMTRLLRESIRSLKGKIIETGFDAVVIVRPAARLATLVQIRDAVEDLLRKAKLLECDPSLVVGAGVQLPPQQREKVNRRTSEAGSSKGTDCGTS